MDAKQGRINIHRLKGSISAVYPMQPDVLKAVRSYVRTRADESPYLFVSNHGVPISRFMLHHLMQTYGAVSRPANGETEISLLEALDCDTLA